MKNLPFTGVKECKYARQQEIKQILGIKGEQLKI